MAKTFIQPGTRLTYVNATGDPILSGDVVFVNTLPGIAQCDIANGEDGELEVCGVQRLAKETPLVISQGDTVYWDDTAKEVTKTVTDMLLGTAWISVASGATTVDVKLLDIAAAVPAAAFDQAATVAAVSAANATDLGSAQTLANANKTAINAMLTALKNAGIMAS